MIDCDELERVETAPLDDVSSANMDSLITDLGSKDGFIRQSARTALIQIGEPAVEYLIKAFKTESVPTHWEAAKALSLIGDPKSVRSLVQALEDNAFSIRWLAAEGLITVGYCSLAPLLEALVNRSESVRLREGAHHVLHDLVSRHLLDRTSIEHIKPVLAALKNSAPASTVPIVAHRALNAL